MRWIIGIDEVGRGALAGPVVVAAALMPSGLRFGRGRGSGDEGMSGTPSALKDSKKLSPARRQAWLDHLKSNPRIQFVFARVYPRNIERLNISQAANLAALRAFRRLSDLPSAPRRLSFSRQRHQLRCSVYLDGGLFLGNGDQPKQAKTIVKADEKINAVKIASIAAKVHRDRFMCRLAKRYPAYGFEIHKGYGTKAHRAAIRRHGPSDAHRLTFLGKKLTMK